MAPELAKLALQFMLRVPLQGNEVGAFAQVAEALKQDAMGAEMAPEPAAPSKPTRRKGR